MAAHISMVILGFSVILLATSALGGDARCRGPFCRDRIQCDPLGVTCHDCHSKLICTPFGGIITPCWLPGHRHCSNGRCVREPSPECLPTTTEPTSTTSTSEQPTPTTEGTSTTERPTSTTEGPTPTTEPTSTTSRPTSSTEGLSTTGPPPALSTTEGASTAAPSSSAPPTI